MSSTPLVAQSSSEPVVHLGSHNQSVPIQSGPVVESLNISAPATGSVVEIKVNYFLVFLSVSLLFAFSVLCVGRSW